MTTPIPEILRPRAQALAQHEFGHFITALVLGFEVIDVSLQIQMLGDHRGKSRSKQDIRCESVYAIQHYIRSRVAILLAGAAAEAINCSTYQIDQARAANILSTGETGAETDYATAKELLQLLYNILPIQKSPSTGRPATAPDLLNEIWKQTLKLVTMNARPICELASTLVNRITSPYEVAVLPLHEIEQMPAYRLIYPHPPRVNPSVQGVLLISTVD
jgi:hypothetical protein